MSDFISKSRLKWEIEKWYEKEYYSSFNAAVYNALLKIIDKFPSVEPEKCGDVGEISDGYHTFNQLYHQRAILFAAIVNQNKGISWKSYKHSDGKYCFDSDGEWFIVGVDTPEGPYTYHYSKEYWDYFDCQILECGKEWDGHTEDDVTRLLSLPSVEPEKCGDCVSRQAAIEAEKEMCKYYTPTKSVDHPHIDFVIEELQKLPSVEPERKTGKWIMSHDKNAKLYGKCNNCGMRNYAGYTNYCPDCGAKMMDEQSLKYADNDTAFGGLQSAT